MTGWIVYDKKQYEKNKWFAEHLKKCCESFADMKIIISEYLTHGFVGGKTYFFYCGKLISCPGFAIIRTINPSLSKVLELSGIKLFNNSEISKICNNKYLTYLYMKNNNIKIMDTALCRTKSFDSSALSEFRHPFVMKSLSGHGGSEVFWISDEVDFLENIGKIKEESFIIQRPCKTLGKDLRVYILGDEILAAVLRTGKDFKSNYSLGGTAEIFNLTDENRALVEKIISSLPSIPDFVGIDFLVNGKELIFNEIEDVVGTRMLYDKTDIDPAMKYAEYIKERMTSNES